MPNSILISFKSGDRERFFAPDEDSCERAVQRLINGETYDGDRIQLWDGVSVEASQVTRFEIR
ncbi:MAG: hypothetical protein R3A46_18345 [Thermomicrobiales bacterium]